jgi:hypothetical protein
VPSSRTAAATRARWANTTPEQRREATRKARLTHAVNELVRQWPELTPEQMARLRALLQPVGGGRDEAA